MDERWQQLDSLFHEALTRAPAERPAFLDAKCVNDLEMRREVEALLAAHDLGVNFLETLALHVEARALGSVQSESNAETMVGRQINQYRILQHLGSGGMGAVYLAQDTNLGRQVALKLLPQQFTADSERLRRFELEARTASALNHPNILTIYEIGQASSLRYIATEFVDGVTLRELIKKGPLLIDEAVDIASQVADALTSAHAKGIVHRDIKPENIMISSGPYLNQGQGHVKVLDFGIAKLTEPNTVGTDLPTRPLAITSDGITMGTAPYMSPEQASGAKVDARTDLWSLSVVLYEMLSGRAPFEGPTSSHLIVSILEKEPPPLRELQSIPESLEWIVNKGLRKNKDERYQTARELYGDLKEFRQQSKKPDRKSVEPIESKTKTTVPSRASSLGRRGLIITVGVVALIGTVLGVKYLGTRLTATSATPFRKFKLNRLTTSGKANSAAISPDGKYVVHVVGTIEQKSLWLRHIATGSDKEIVPANGSDISHLSFSPDGDRIYYLRSDRTNTILETVPVLGGPPRELMRDLDTTVTFAPDGQRFAFVRGDPSKGDASLIIAGANGGLEQKLITHPMGDFFFGTAGDPAWSPDGEKIAFVLRDADSYRNIVEVNLKSKTERQITHEQWNGIQSICWLPDGKGLLFTAIDLERRNTQIFFSSYPEGKVEQITNDLNNYEDISISANGTDAITVMSEGNSEIWISSAATPSNAVRITSNSFDGVGGLDWTPDGKLAHVSNNSGTRDIWIMNADGSADRQLTAKAGLNLMPCTSADGKYVVFTSNRVATGTMNLWRINIDGSNPTQLAPGKRILNAKCTRDNQIIYSSDAQGESLVWKVPVEGGAAVQITDYYSSVVAPSPVDDKLLVSFLDKSTTPPQPKIGLITTNGGKPTKSFQFPAIFGTLGGGFYSQVINWMPDGKSLTFIENKDGVSNIWLQPIDGGPKRQLTNFTSDLIFNYDWSHDGKKLAIARGSKTSNVVLLRDETR